MPNAISARQRYTRGRPCPICGGWDGMRRGKGERCAGYWSTDGLYAYCTREECAGRIQPSDTSPAAYAHKLYGDCLCGLAHNLVADPGQHTGQPSPSSRSSSRRPARANTAASAKSAKAAQRQERPQEQPEAPDAPASRSHKRRRPDAIYGYCTADGAALLRVLRYGSGKGKRFVQQRPDGAGDWLDGLGPFDRINYPAPLLYRLPALLAADPAQTVYIAEGEKCADALAAAGLVATCNLGGALKWRPQDSAALAGRAVVILPDHDGPNEKLPTQGYAGQRHALDVAAALASIAASVRILPLDAGAGLAVKGDVADWLAAGHTCRELETLAASAAALDRDAYAARMASAPGWPEWSATDPTDTTDTADAPGTPAGSRGAGAARAVIEAPHELAGHIAIDGTTSYVCLDPPHIGRETRGKETGPQCRRSHSWLPVPLRTIEAPEMSQGQRVWYEIEIRGDGAGANAGRRALVSESDLAAGEWLESFPGLPGTNGTANIALLANVIKRLATTAGLVIEPGYCAIGWHRDAAGRWLYILPDGRALCAGGAYGAPVPLLETEISRGELARDFRERMPALPASAADPVQLADLCQWIADVSPAGQLALLLGTAARALLHDLTPARASALLIGEAGTGKTGLANFARNLIGPCAYRTPPDASFNDTPASIEARLAALQSYPAIVDDMTIPRNASHKDLQAIADKIDRHTRATFNNTPTRRRRTSRMQAQREYKTETLPIWTGEALPPVLLSFMRRSLLLTIERGDVDIVRFSTTAADYERTLTAWGHMLLCGLAARRDADAATIERELAAEEARISARILASAERVLGEALTDARRSLAEVWARPLLGLWALERLGGVGTIGGVIEGSTPDAREALALLLAHAEGAAVRFLVAQAREMSASAEDAAAPFGRLVALLRGRIASGQLIGGQGWALERYGLPLSATDTAPGLSDVPDSVFGFADPADTWRRPVIAGWVDERRGAVYLRDIACDELVRLAAHTDGCGALTTDSALARAAEREGWLAFRGDGRHILAKVQPHGREGERPRVLALSLARWLDRDAQEAQEQQEAPDTLEAAPMSDAQPAQPIQPTPAPMSALDASDTADTGDTGAIGALVFGKRPGVLAGLPDVPAALPYWKRAGHLYELRGAHVAYAVEAPGERKRELRGRPLFAYLAGLFKSGDDAKRDYAERYVKQMASVPPVSSDLANGNSNEQQGGLP